MKQHAKRLSLTGAIVAAVSMLVLSVFNSLGLYENAVVQMQSWHMFYSPDFVGTITGMIEAALWTYITIYFAMWVYGRLGKK